MGGLRNDRQQPAVDEQLFQYLNFVVQQEEAASGASQLEMRSKIEALRTETRRVPTLSASEMSEMDVARQLDHLSEKIKSLNKLLKEVDSDPETKNFLSSSSELWMPVITATAEERTNTSTSSSTSSASTPPSAKDGNSTGSNQ